EAEDMDVHLYKSMIGSLMYLTASRPDIMFAVCTCTRFQVTLKVSHLHAVKRIFIYLKGQPKLGLWYPRDSPFDLEAFSNSDYAGASLDKKSTTEGCQFLGKRLISWQCKKQTIVANSTTEVEYVAAANCCGQNPVFHSKTKPIEIRHHFIRDSYEKRLIQAIKIHTDHNVADLLTKAFDVSSDEFRVKTGSCKVNAAKQDLVLLGERTVTPLFASMLVPQVVEGEGLGQPSEPQPPLSTAPPSQEGQVSAVAPSYPQKTQTPRQAKRGRDTKIPQSGGPPEKVSDEAVHKELGDRVERAATTAASLDAVQDSGNITKTESTAMSNDPLSQEIGSCVRPRCQEAMRGVIAQTRSERASKHCYDSPLPGVNTPGSDEDRLEQHELTDNVPPPPYDSPLPGEGLESDLKKTKKLYATAFKKLINNVKSLEDELKFQKSKSKRRRLTLVTSKDEEDLVTEDPSKQGRSLIEEIDLDAGISLVSPHIEVQGRYGQNLETQEGFGDGQEVSTAAQEVSIASPQRYADTTADDLTLVKTLMEIRKSTAKDKGKAKMDETESPRKMKQGEQVQISRDKEVAQKIQEEFDAAERQRVAQVHQAAQGFTDSEWDDVLARVAADEDFV
ncbi:hypothetical protein Tco_1034748, partial [Tanacetum coccineum]